VLKLLSYNVYGKKDVKNPTPSWEIRQENIMSEDSDHRPVIMTIN